MSTLERHNISQAIHRLSEILGVPSNEAIVRHDLRFGNRLVDAVIEIGSYKFAIEWKASGSLGHIFRAVHQVRAMACDLPDSLIPILVVPFMGESARAYCNDAGVAWLDLSGNAKIVAPGLYVHTVGHENKFRRPGRPESAFGPRGSRVARWLLMNPGQVIRQRALASTTSLDEGYVSRVVGRLIDMGLLEREDRGIQVTDSNRLLDAWHDEYRFDKHTVIRGYIAARGGDSLIHSIADTLSKIETPYAATALPAAWLWTRYAGFRLSTVYLSAPPSPGLKSDLGFREEPRGANTWLVAPNDQGVFDGVEAVNGIPCVHPVQTYVDLKNHPERATEAAAELRRRLLLRSMNDL